jgi:FkbM family methyltransferase
MLGKKMTNEKRYSEPPVWLKTIGKISRALPNYPKLKWGLMLIFKNKIEGKNYRTIVRYDLGQKIVLNLDDWIPSQIFWCGLYLVEKKETEFFKKLIEKGHIVIDIGANIGYYTLMAAARVGKNGRVYSFEPCSSTFKLLQENIKINKSENVVLSEMAVLDKEGNIELYLSEKTNTGSTSISFPTKYSGKKENVKCITLDKFIKEKKLKKVDVIKIDTEGAELKVLKGMEKLLSVQSPKVLIEINEENLNALGSSKEDIYAFFRKLGYQAYDIKTSKIIKEPIEGNLILFYKKEKTAPN